MSTSEIADHFLIPGRVSGIDSFGKGHIHKTYKVSTSENQTFILQQLNDFVFKDPVCLTENALKICAHLQMKADDGLINWQIPHLLPLKKDGYLLNVDGKYWRMMNFIHHSLKHSTVESNIFVTAGNAYGMFNLAMEGLPASSLCETIPDFHNLGHHYALLQDARYKGIPSRKNETKEECFFLEDNYAMASRIPEMKNSGMIPLRLTHNDTKMDNILFDSEGKVISIIDLDTVMPGIIHSDYGDALRSFAATAGENVKDTAAVRVNMEAFKDFTRGFLAAVRDLLTPPEKESLVYAPALFAYMQAVRFLNDYLRGDPYYAVSYPEQNLYRSRNQIVLFKAFLKKETEMAGFIESRLQN